jgi:hypothetical protein
VSDSPANWHRPRYASGGDDAFLFYVVYGPAQSEIEISRNQYRCDGLADGISLSQHSVAEHSEVIRRFREGDLWERFGPEDPRLAQAILAETHCTVISGQVADPSSLNYFRDTIGLVTYFLDHGGIAVYDPQMLRWWSAAEWRDEVFAPAAPLPRRHVVILASPEDDGTTWFHTRGLRKFGRPDLSIRRVPAAGHAAATDLCDRFIELQAFGALIPEGQEIRMSGVPEGMRCVRRGDENDPDFNNAHVEIVWTS